MAAPEPPDEAPAKSEAGYPPGTYHLMSWAAIRFIQKPSSRVLQGLSLALVALIAVGLAASFLISVDLKVAGEGEIVAEPAVRRVTAFSEGVLVELRKNPGDAVSTGEVIAVLKKALQDVELEALLEKLKGNIVLIEEADRKRGLSPDLELGQRLSSSEVPELFDGAAAVQAAHRELGQSLSGDGPYERNKNTFISLNRSLEGKLSAYLERHRIRASCDGTIVSLHVAAAGAIRPGDVIVSILPTGARLIAQLKMPSSEVPKLQVGQKALHRLEAFPFQRFGVFEGKVEAIEQKVSDSGKDDNVEYVVKATVVPPANVRVALGMRVAANIVVGRKLIKDIALDRLFGLRR